MALNKVFAILILCLSFTAFGQEKFLDICLNPLPHAVEIQNDMKWLKYFFKTTDCNVVVEKMSNLTSFNEFMVPLFRQPPQRFSWISDFPYLTGITNTLSIMEGLRYSKIGFYPDETNVFIYPELYSEFKNLRVLDLTKSFNFKIDDLCNIKENFPYIDTLIVSVTDVSIMENECSDYEVLPWMIVTHWTGVNRTKLKDKIIGFMEFRGSVQDLKVFQHLQYLGIDNRTEQNDMKFIAVNLNLTHISMNINFGVKNIERLKYVTNLRSLTITCIDNSSLNEFENFLFIKTCKTPFLKDLSFLAELPFLERLNLVSNGLEDVSVVEKLTNLTHLNLSHNKILKMPDLKALKRLQQFDIKENPVSKK